MISPRLDYAIDRNNTLILRFNHTSSTTEGGVGQFSLPDQEYTQASKTIRFKSPKRPLSGQNSSMRRVFSSATAIRIRALWATSVFPVSM